MDYFQALTQKRASVVLGDESFEAEQAPLGRALRLQTIQQQIMMIFGTREVLLERAEEIPNLLTEYLQIATCMDGNWIMQKATVAQALTAWVDCLALNALDMSNPLLQATVKTKAHKTARETEKGAFAGAFLIYCVDLLCSEYHWTRDFILTKVMPDEALLYIIEIERRRHREHEFEYMLSEVGFEKAGKSYRKVPFPAIPWESAAVPDVKYVKLPREIVERFEPQGAIDLTQGRRL